MRILYLHPDAWTGEYPLLRKLRESGNEVCVLEEDRGLPQGKRRRSDHFREAGDGIATFWYHPGRGWERLLTWPLDRVFRRAFDGRNLVHRMWVVAACVGAFRPDAVVCSDGFSYGIAAAFLKRLGWLGPRLVVSYIGGDILDCPEAEVGKRFEAHYLEDKFLRGEGFVQACSHFYNHHDCHALPAAYYSGFRECAVVTMDGNGDWNMIHTSGVWREGRYERRHVTSAVGASAGLFYSHITRLLGFQALRHEGKVVGLAAMGDPEPLYGTFSRALSLAPDGNALHSEFVGQPQAEARRYEFLRSSIEGHSRENISAAAQRLLEDVVVRMVRRFLAESGMRQVALNGGVFANVKLNQRIADMPEVDSVFVFSAMSDTGNSVGAALLELAQRDPALLKQSRPLEHVYWGPAYDGVAIQAALDEAGVQATEVTEDEMVARAARDMHEGKVVGWFQGRMEFGPRALGNRSMLARPTDARINDWLNQRLDRSEFMPFAPSALAEHADDLFAGVSKARHTAEFMTITFDVRPEWRSRIPAVVHVDGTARPQLVRREANPLYHRLISAYYALSGIPLVLNTSFNVHEEPIVCAPRDAIRAFVERRVDRLAIGPYWLEHP